MSFSDWLVGLRASRPVVRVRRRASTAVVPAAVRPMEPRVMLSASASPWQQVAAFPPADATGDISYLNLSDYAPLVMNESALRQTLDRAPDEAAFNFSVDTNTIALADPDGNLERFAIYETAIMAPELAAQFPEIKTYAGQGIDDPTATVQLDLTPQGFHAQVLSAHGRWYIDPYYHLNDDYYASYYTRNATASPETRAALQAEGEPLTDVAPPTGSPAAKPAGADGSAGVGRSGTQLRTYRTAVAADGEYTAFQGGNVVAGQSAIVTAVNRVSGIYETELSIRLQLIANNSSLVYTDAATDPYTNTNPGLLLSENQANIDSVIGNSNYDIGHVFTTGGGGLAGLGVVGINARKAQGETGLPAPTGDDFYVDYVAHEMGHQFGGNHTFNQPDSNRNASTAYEPGSGATIMAYAGLFGVDDLQLHSDPYFHSVSFDEIITHVDTVIPGVGTRTATGNNVPTVNAGLDYTIPASTPFALTATGADADGTGSLTYNWEERDLGAAQTLSAADNGSSPLFRSFTPTTDPTRTFLRLPDLINGTTTKGEKLPTTTRDMKFRATVRDNAVGGGGVNTDDMVVHVVNTGTPFRVTSPNTALSWNGGSSQTVTWDVGGTDANGINVANVRILLSTDGGNTFNTVLSASEPNDGSAQIVVPSIGTTQARVKVEAIGNIFFDFSDANFTIVAGPNQSPVVDDQSFSIAENGTNGAVVGTVAATDPDLGQTLAYAITGGTGQGVFAINGATGEITVADDSMLDFATAPTLTLNVQVTDNGSPSLNDAAVITINVTDANDPPVVSPATFTVFEFASNGSVIGAVSATDPNPGQTLTYSLLSGNAGNAFAINAATGQITVANSAQINFSLNPSFSLLVQATDSGVPAASGSATITINVSQINLPPYLPDQNFRVFEGSPPGTLVGTIFASDPNIGQPLVFSITGGNAGNAFALNPTTGKLTVNNPFAVDFETMPLFNLTVQVRDTTATPLIRTANMRVEVLDVVEQPVIQPQSFTVAENRPVGYVVGTVVASHFDPMKTLTYAITGGNADGIFAINAATGQLKVAKATLSFETTPEVTLTVTVTDNGMPAESRSASMTITVLDLNEAPVFPPATFNISENRPVGYVVGSVKAFDQDIGQSLTYAITSGNTNGAFAINANTGVLTVAQGTLNHEAMPQFLLTVSATDNGAPMQSRSAAVTVTVLDLNEPPVINPQTFTVSENRAVGFVVGQIAAFDQDLGQTLTYAITGGDPDGIFAVNLSGQLVVARPILNFEAVSTFPLLVSVTDNGSPVQARSAAVTVNVRDLNEAPVVNPQTFNIAEKLPLGAVVGMVTAFDQDLNQTLQFAIAAGNTSGAFAVDAATGQITVANPAALLFDVNPEFNLSVTVADNGVPVQSRTAAIKVKLLKVNAKPVVAPQRFAVLENGPAGTDVGTVVATDSDAGQTLKYAITGGNVGNAFAINMTTGKITVANPAAIDFEASKLFQLTVSATDNGTPVQVGTGMVTIDVLNANDPPVVTNQTFQVAENVPANTLVGTVLAQDPEGLPNLKYEIVGGNPNGAFAIDPNTGAVRVSAPFMFDFETNPQLSFLLKVSDSGTPAMSSTATITFQLTNLNDPPVVPNQTFSVSRTANNGSTVGVIAASDPDAGQSLKYEIVGGNGGTAFGINLNTGVLFVANRNALTARASIPLTVKVTDNGSNNLSATAGITVNVTNGAAVVAAKPGRAGESKPALPGTLASQAVTPSASAAPVTKPKASTATTVSASEGTNALLQRAVAGKVTSETQN